MKTGTQELKTYCIRADYVPNEVNHTLDTEKTVFWDNDNRVAKSALYQWQVYRYARSLAKRHGIRNVLDVGCGPGVKLVDLLSDLAEVYGIDQKSAIDYCRNTHKKGIFYYDNFENPQVSLDVPFGLIICSDVIEHMTNPDSLLDYIKRFCSKDTLVLFSTPDRDRLRGKDCLRSVKEEHVREWNSEEFRRYIELSGFTVIEHIHVPPVKTAPNLLFLKHFIIQVLMKRLPYRHNQVVLCRLD